MTGTLGTGTFTAINGAIAGLISRSFAARATDTLNAREYVTANGVTDNTAGLQALLDQAWGAPNSPNGNNGRTANCPIFIPPGAYVVSSPAAMTVSNMTRGSDAQINGTISGTTLTVNSVTSGAVAVGQEVVGAAGSTVIVSGSGSTWTVNISQSYSSATMVLVADVVVTVNSTTNYLSGHIVNIAGATATTSPAGAINSPWGIAVIDGTRIALMSTRAAWFGFTSYTSGGSVTRAALQGRSIRGGWLFGGGRESTRLITTDTNGSVFACNGMDYSRVEGIGFEAMGTGVGFDFNWDNTGSVALQSTTFAQDSFGGDSNTDGIGLQFGACGYQGSESLLLNCHFTHRGTGFYNANQNALQNNIIGGNCQDCNWGIKIIGSVPLIASMGFQVGGTFDIEQVSAGSFADGMFVIGCRSEQVSASGGFMKNLVGTSTVLINCSSTGPSNHDFLQFVGATTCIGCWSPNGRVYCPANNEASLYGFANRFDRSDYWQINQACGSPALTGGFNSKRLAPDSSGNLVNATFASLPTAAASLFGALVPVIDSSTAVAGATITGGGANLVLGFCNGTNWIVK